MERLVTVKAMCERYGCSLPTARKYIRECNPHMENPCATFEWALREWEEKRTVINPDVSKKRRVELMAKQKQGGRVIVPRTWEG